ncbi:hypothetical protein AXF42_Ash016239 [Apostasia shenzhenica]|uniref:Cell wall protein n=1 Tax=Apostasia shenzhenica TaxID=1088818 RepID=A0A2H9ZX93_9ASPA|nr:hypothetical protein AXF42_Ash016239 [Apostasia shenzhenica]
MAKSTASCRRFVVLILGSLILFPVAISAARLAPADPNTLKQKECIDGVGGAFNVPSLGRYVGGGAGRNIGGPGSSSIGSVGGLPPFTDLDHSGPAAANGRYIPGFDDTFVPNPGYEVPRQWESTTLKCGPQTYAGEDHYYTEDFKAGSFNFHSNV